MSKAARKIDVANEQEREGQLPVPYDVGYGKPPAERRFKKGQSGNPGGRPRGARNKVPRSRTLEVGTQPANQMLLEEAYRTIAVREGEKIVELPVIKAVFRSMGVSAMKGNRLAQATMAELVREIEEEDRKTRTSHFETACDYKWGWEQAIEHARQHGLPEPAPLPHPSDVIIDVRNSEVRYEGPITPEEKKHWDRLLEFRDELQVEVSLHAGGYRRAAEMKKPPLDHMKFLASHWERYTAMYDRMNNPLPDRYRKTLEDRFNSSLVAGAARGDRK